MRERRLLVSRPRGGRAATAPRAPRTAADGVLGWHPGRGRRPCAAPFTNSSPPKKPEKEAGGGGRARAQVATHVSHLSVHPFQPTHGNIIRLAPPLCISEGEALEAAEVIVEVIESFD